MGHGPGWGHWLFAMALVAVAVGVVVIFQLGPPYR